MIQAPIMGFFEYVILMAAYTGLSVPFGLPPGPEDPFLSQIAPESPLFYASWAGSVEVDANSTNQTERMLAEPEIQRMFAELPSPIMKIMEMNVPADAAGKLVTDTIREWLPKLARRPGAIFVSDVAIDKNDIQMEGALVVNLGEDASAAQALLEKFDKVFFGGQIETERVAGATFRKIQVSPAAPAIYWGVRKQHLIFGLGENGAKGVIARSKTETPQWLANVRDDLAIPRRSMLAFFNFEETWKLVQATSRELPHEILEEIGVQHIKAVAMSTGLNDSRSMNVTKVITDGVVPPILEVFASRPISQNALSSIPKDSNLALSIDIDLEKAFTILQAMAKANPGMNEEFKAGIAFVNQLIGGDLKTDVIRELSGTWSLFNSPSEGGVFLTGLTAIAELQNGTKLQAVNQRIAALLKQQQQAMPGVMYGAFEQGDVTVHSIFVQGSPLVLSWCLDDDRFLVSANQQNIRTVLNRNENFASIKDHPQLKTLRENSTMVTFVDSRQLVEMFYPPITYMIQPALFEMSRSGIQLDISLLPTLSSFSKYVSPNVSSAVREENGIKITSHQTIPGVSLSAVVPMAASASLPPIVFARAAARQAQSTNNMKQIALAILNHESAFQKFPAAALRTKEGKPALSWRVAILPFLEEQALYNEFHLDEPWDSPHNIALIDRMPQVYRSPTSKADPTKTVYLAIRGKQSPMVEDGKGLRIRNIIDGLSKTILAIEVDDEKAVPWTKPDDFEWQEKDPAKGLSQHEKSFLAVFCDVKENAAITSFRNLVLNRQLEVVVFLTAD